VVTRPSPLTPGNPSGRIAYSVVEVAALCGLSVPHIRSEIKRGKLRSVRSRRRLLVLARDLDRYLAAGASRVVE